MSSGRKTGRSRLPADAIPSPAPATKRKRSASPSHASPQVNTIGLEQDANDVDPGSTLDSSEDVEIEGELVTVDVMLPIEGEEVSIGGADQEPEKMESGPCPETPGNMEPANEENSADTEKTSSTLFVFKDPNFVHSNKGASGNKRTRVWKNLKQIVAAERTLPWGPDDVTYGSIDAPPSFKPAKKYSDISGLESKYTDPQTKMRYANADEYRRVRMLPGDIITGCLALRKANTLVP